MSTTLNELSQEEIDVYQRAFDAFDTDKTGDITVEELGELFRNLRQNPGTTELQDIISEFDTDRNGTVSFAEFIDMMTRKTSNTDVEAEMKAAFDVFDSDHCGFISADELKTVMSTIGEKLTDSEFEEIIKEADTNCDGKISYEEFVSIINVQ